MGSPFNHFRDELAEPVYSFRVAFLFSGYIEATISRE